MNNSPKHRSSGTSRSGDAQSAKCIRTELSHLSRGVSSLGSCLQEATVFSPEEALASLLELG